MKPTRMTLSMWTALAGLALTSVLAGIPAQAEAQSKRRQETKNEWRNLAIGSGVVALLGLVKNDSTLTFAGAAGALYSAHRYEEDRKSQSKTDRARAALFARSSFSSNGYKYTRKTKWKNGKKYYYFVKHKSR